MRSGLLGGQRDAVSARVGNSSDICQGQPDNSTLTMVIYWEAFFMMRNSFESGAIRG
jgi:hypothetical protein